METRTETSSERDAGAERVRPRRGWLIAGVILGVVAIAAAAYWLIWLSSNGTSDQTAPPRTVEVVRTDLAEVETLDGTLGFSEGDSISSGFSGILTSSVEAGDVVTEGTVLYSVDAEPIVLLYGGAPAFRDIGMGDGELTVINRIPGTLTETAPEDSTASQGSILYEVNDQPVTLLYGETPAWRTMRRNVEGGDVLQLEEALVALGYDPDGTVTIDEDFTSSTEAMVERWQADIGADEDGRVDLGEVVFLAGPIQVSQVLIEVGASAGASQPIMAVAPITESARPDVAQLQASLLRLGFGTGLEVNGIFDAGTEGAVRRWQESVGSDADGVVDLGEVIFLPGPVRIADELVTLGSPVQAGTPVLATSSSEIVVTVDLPAADRDLLAEGDSVSVVLPNGSEEAGSVQSISSVALRDQSGAVTFEVMVAIDDAEAAFTFDQAPVDVEVVTDSRAGVLAVPVTALLALAEGGYAVEVQESDASTRLIPVEPGLFAEGLVEISSPGLEPGLLVVVP